MEGPFIVIGVIALIALVGLVFLMRFVARGALGGHRVGLLIAVFAVSVLAFLVCVALTSVYYARPWWLVAALVLFGAAVIGLFALIGMRVGWEWRRVLSMIGIGFGLMVLFATTAMAAGGQAGKILPFEMRAKQIAEAKGFTALLPEGETLNTESRPVDPLEKPAQGMWIEYKGFWMEERKEGTSGARGTLEERLMDALPKGYDDLKLDPVTIQGERGLAVDFTVAPPKDGPPEARKTELGTGVIVVLGNADVRLWSQSGVSQNLDGGWVQFPGKSSADLVKIAETLQPVK